jgi:hypothetical protein
MSDTTTPAAPAPGPQLQVSTIAGALQIIDMLVDSAGLKGWKMISEVAQVRTDLVNFLNAIPAPAPEPAPATPAETPAA